MGVRVSVGFRDSVGVPSGQIFPLGGFGAHGVSGAFGAHGLLRAAPLATNCWPEAPRGGGGGVVGVLGPAELPGGTSELHPHTIIMIMHMTRMHSMMCTKPIQR